MTEKLFYTDTHITEFAALVLECRYDDKRKLYATLLDRTAFFPEEGGQSADTGILDGQTVKDVKIRQDDIWHYTGAPLTEGTQITGTVDWATRFDYMQQHSGEHILSGLVYREYGYHNVGFHLGKEEVTLDFDGSLTPDALRTIEQEANAAIWKNLPIQVSFPAPDVLSQLTYRSKIEIEGAVRIVEIPGYDTCACCAPHVDTTGQIGLIKITGVMSHRGGVRLNILCGGRALDDYTRKQTNVTAVSVLLSAKPDTIPDAVTRLLEEAFLKQQRINQLQSELLSRQLASLPSPEANAHAVLFTGDLDTIAMRNAVNSLCEAYSGYCGIFAGTEPEACRFIIASRHLDCTLLAARLRETLGAKCGGSSLMIQGSLNAAPSDIELLIYSF